MPPEDFHCKQCGRCTMPDNTFPICADEEDVKLWEREKRDDILNWVDSIQVRGGEYVHTIWVDPVEKVDMTQCPWLKKLPHQSKYMCQIHDAKPARCKQYPKAKKDSDEK